MENKIEINKKLIGKTVRVIEESIDWFGEVVSVKDENTFIVSNGISGFEVDIFNVRSVADEQQ